MKLELELWQLSNIMKATAREAVEEYRRMIDPSSDEITERKAQELYGRGWLDEQKALGRVTWIRAGKHKNSRKIYSISQLNSLKYGESPLLKAIYN